MAEDANDSVGGILASARPRVLLLSPITPAASGNGLAMRAAAIEKGLETLGLVHTVVLGVSDPGSHLPLPDPLTAARSWLLNARGRQLLESVEALPQRARQASPAAGEQFVGLLGALEFDLVYVLRLYCAGAALPLLQRWPDAVSVLDLDEDDARVMLELADLARGTGNHQRVGVCEEEAHRLRGFADIAVHWFDRLVASTPLECKLQQARYPVHSPQVVANCITPPERLVQIDGDGVPCMVFVGNLDYSPNCDAVFLLLERILPKLQSRCPQASLHIVGRGADDLADRFGAVSGVHWHGFVENLAAVYQQANMAVIPLRAGGGSRIKLLEAMAQGLPVVATAKAAEGLAVEHAEQLLLGESVDGLAEQAMRLVLEPGLADSLRERALEWVRREHNPAVIARQLQSLC